MATTKKKKPTKQVASSKPAAAANELKAKSRAPKPPTEPKVEPKEVSTKPETARKTRTFHIHLVGGASYSSKGHNFVAGRPLITTDEKVFKKFENNGRFRIDIREGGA